MPNKPGSKTSSSSRPGRLDLGCLNLSEGGGIGRNTESLHLFRLNTPGWAKQALVHNVSQWPGSNCPSILTGPHQSNLKPLTLAKGSGFLIPGQKKCRRKREEGRKENTLLYNPKLPSLQDQPIPTNI